MGKLCPGALIDPGWGQEVPTNTWQVCVDGGPVVSTAVCCWLWVVRDLLDLLAWRVLHSLSMVSLAEAPAQAFLTMCYVHSMNDVISSLSLEKSYLAWNFYFIPHSGRAFPPVLFGQVILHI